MLDNGELVEIYGEGEDSFSVAQILSYDDRSVWFRAYDDQGQNDGLLFVSRDYIQDVRVGTAYLEKMALYLGYWTRAGQQPLANPFVAHPTALDVIAYAEDNGKVITVASETEPEELVTGYVADWDDATVTLDTIDAESARSDETLTLQIDEIFYLEVDSVDNALLQYANQEIER